LAEREIVVRSDSGGALVFAMMALVVVAVAVMIVAHQVETLEIPLRHEHRSAVLATLSDAAFAEALAKLSVDPGFLGLAERRFAEGRVASQVTPAGATSVQVTAVGSYRDWRAVIQAEVDLTDGPRVIWVERSQHLVADDGQPSGSGRATGRTQ
jgi:hypothetical protein